METSLKKQAKQFFSCGSHEFWIMSHENRVISLSFVPIQTTFKSSYRLVFYLSNFPIFKVVCHDLFIATNLIITTVVVTLC